MERITDFLFDTVLFSFSAMVLVLMLFGCVRLSQSENRTEKLELMILEQRSENRMLQAQCESGMSLSELEDYALNELGMQPCRPRQIVYLDAPEMSEG